MCGCVSVCPRLWAHSVRLSGCPSVHPPICPSVCLSSRLRLWHTLRMSDASNFNAISMRWCECVVCVTGCLQVCGFAHVCIGVWAPVTVVVFKCMPICMAFVNTFRFVVYLLRPFAFAECVFKQLFIECSTLFTAHLWHLVCCTHIAVVVPAVVVARRKSLNAQLT